MTMGLGGGCCLLDLCGVCFVLLPDSSCWCLLLGKTVYYCGYSPAECGCCVQLLAAGRYVLRLLACLRRRRMQFVVDNILCI